MKTTHWVLLFLLTITAVLPLSRVTSQTDKTGGEPVTAVAPLPRLSTDPARYIIQLNAPPLASVMGQAQPTAVSQYQKILEAQQAAFINTLSQELGHPVEPLFRYTVAYNGMTLTLNGTEAARVAGMSEVTAVTPDHAETLLTDAGPAWINTDAIWDGSGVPGDTPGKGEGVIIGVIDTGINMDHPSFAAVGGDGYVHQNPLGDGNYKGVCDPASDQYNAAFACNAKLIGAWDFADVYGESDGPEDSNGHGSHTASTAAGNVVNASLTTPAGYTYLNNISGVAPHANLIAYDACVTASCPTSSLLAAVNQAVADGVDVISYSISGGTSPYADPVEQAFLAANEAGVIVSAAAGNSGPDPSTLSHQGPWVMTVGASTHNRVFRNSLTNFSGGDGSLADIFGESLTGGYGPAPIVYAGDYGDAQCLSAFPPGTWSGEIVVCDRGIIARVQKAENVLAGGAGGYVLANTAVEGDSLSSDAYALPGVHIGYADGLALKNWLAVGSNHMAQIGGTTAVFDNTAADKMASFSSRGPNTAMDTIKPDIVAPGVNILAADKTTQVLAPPEYRLLSGTSMATPHMSGAAALLRQVQPAWTPDEIRSALMMTAVHDAIQKENGQTANPFDRGAGRVDLSRAAQAGLVLHETRANYEAAETGDPATLNLPSLAQNDCFQSCNWTRAFRSTLTQTATWTVTAETPPGLQLSFTPSQFTIQPGQTQAIQITADVGSSPTASSWVFATMVLSSPGQATLRLPIAVQKSTASNPTALSKSAPTFALPGTVITYEITLDNLDAITHTFNLTDTLPPGLEYIPGSATGGLAYDAGSRQLTWQGEMGPGTPGYEVTAVTPWIPYVNLGDLTTPPPNLCGLFANCDDTAVQFDLTGESVTYYNETLNQLFVSANGVIYGPEGHLGVACTACPQRLPNGVELNQVIAGLWRDMDASAGIGQWYAALLDGWLPTDTVFYANWNEVAQAGDPALTSSHAIAVVLDGQSEPNGRIYYTYAYISDRGRLEEAGYAIGLENKTGNQGETLAYAPCYDSGCIPSAPVGDPPANGVTWRLDPAIVGGDSALTFTFQARVTAPTGTLLTNLVQASNDSTPDLLAATADTLVEYRYYFPVVTQSP